MMNFSSILLVAAVYLAANPFVAPATNDSCIAPPTVNVSTCCETPIPFTAEVLSKCQDSQTKWLAGGNSNKTTGLQCGSECIIAEMKDMSGFFTALAQAPSPKWLEWLTQFLTSTSVCTLKLDYLKQFLLTAVGSKLHVCDVDILTMTDCISRDMFLTCSSRNSSKDCMSLVSFLSGPCRFSDLVKGAIF